MKAIISLTPGAGFMGQPEVVETIEITSCVNLILDLARIAKYIRERPLAADNTTLMMAHIIGRIELALQPELERLSHLM